MYTVYSHKFKSWCVFKDDYGRPTATLIKSGFETYEQAKAWIASNK